MSADQGDDELRIALLLRRRGVGPDAAAAQPQAESKSATHVQPNDRPDPAEPETEEPTAPADSGDAADGAGAADTRSPVQPRIPAWWTGRHVDLTAPEADTTDEVVDSEHVDDQDDDGRDLAEEHADHDQDDEDEGEPGAAAPAARRLPKLRSRSRGRVLPSRRAAAPSPAPAASRALVDTSAAPRLSLLDAAAAVPPRIRWLVLHATAAAAGYRLGWVDYTTRSTAWVADHGTLTPTALTLYALAVGCELLRRRFSTWPLPVRWLAAMPISSAVTGIALYGTDWSTLELPL